MTKEVDPTNKSVSPETNSRERLRKARTRINNLHKKVACLGETTLDDVYTADVLKGNRKTKAVVAYDSEDYINDVIFWPVLSDGKLSPRFLCIRDDHEGEDDYYLDKGYRYLYMVRVRRINLFSEGGEINSEAVDIITDFELNHHYPNRETGVLEAAKFIGDVDLNSLKPIA